MRNNSRKPSFEFDCDSIGAKLKSMIPFSFGVFAESLLKAVKTLRKPAVVAVMLGLLLMYDPNSALAASGGRMGGRSFSSGSSSSSRSYRTAPSGGLSYSAPYFGPSPFSGGGVYVGPAVGVGVGQGVLTATDKTTVLKLQVVLACMTFTLPTSYLGHILGVAFGVRRLNILSKVLLVRGMHGKGKWEGARSGMNSQSSQHCLWELQRDLNRIAETADTSTTEGLSYILTETTLALLRHPDYCISGYSSVDVKRSIEEGEKRFNRLSLEERGKFDEETLVNVNNIKKQSTTSHRVSGFRNEYIVVRSSQIGLLEMYLNF
ncbi:hypothetical protein CK203_094359 [Vitis vinifera]|uniref:Uncharacterized protein n=1 Tax=Vitis vinifera TaxID=29760 RepID=A0A438CW80_VITVI|nr:hypothetical protein CK203_094359 [Vitis vinifera]